jgi:hypothetical protein
MTPLARLRKNDSRSRAATTSKVGPNVAPCKFVSRASIGAGSESSQVVTAIAEKWTWRHAALPARRLARGGSSR